MNYILQLNAFWEKASHDIYMTTSTKLVYLALLHFNNGCGWKVKFRAPREDIMHMACVKKKCYYTSLDYLVENGYLKHEKGSGGITSAVFEIVVLFGKPLGSKKRTRGGNGRGMEGEWKGNEGGMMGDYNTKPLNLETTKLLNYKTQFDFFRKKYPGTKKGNKTEFDNLLKKYEKEIDLIIPQLLPAVELEIQHKNLLISKNRFSPPWKNLSTWINNRCWEQEFEIIEDSQKSQMVH